MSSSPTSAGAAAALSSSDGKLRCAGIIIDGDPMHEIGNVARIGQTLRQTQPRGPKPSRRNRSAHRRSPAFAAASRAAPSPGPACAAANIVSTNSMRLPSSTATRSPLSQAELFETGRDLRRLLHHLAPAHPALAADQRLAVGIFRGGIRNHRPDAFRPLGKRRHQPVAEARFEPHRRNGMFRPVHRFAFRPLPSCHRHAPAPETRGRGHRRHSP